MTPLRQSGKFWLKTAVFSLAAVCAVFIVLTASVYHFLSPERIKQTLQTVSAASGRQITVGGDIGRSWLPRPTVILKNLTVSEYRSSRTAATIEETRIGLSWASLWRSRPVIEKWVVSGAHAAITQTDGRWNIEDLYQTNSDSLFPNRLIIEDSTLSVRYADIVRTITHFGLNTRTPDSSGRAFTISGTSEIYGKTLNWQGKGSFQNTASGWKIPEFTLNAAASQTETLSLESVSSISHNQGSGNIAVSGLRLRSDSPHHNLHLAIQSPLLTLGSNNLTFGTLNGTFTAGTAPKQWDGSFKLDKANLRDSIAALDNLEINARYKTDILQTNFSLTAPLLWQKTTGFQSDKVHIATLQDTVDRLPRPRFISLLDGTLGFSPETGWQGSFKGMFDRQPAALTFKYTTAENDKPQFEAGIALQKLNLAPYLDELGGNHAAYPRWLTRPNTPDIAANLSVGSIQAGAFKLDDVETRLNADAEHIALSNFKAGLYGGQTEGGISIANTAPLSYHLQQNAQGIRVQPMLQDLFGFHSFSGNGDAVFNLTAKGSSRKELIGSLKGMLTLNISEGAWHGIDIDNILKNGISAPQNGIRPQTPFHRFTLNSEIDQGISRHIDTELFSDSLHVTSSGYTNLNTQELAEELLIRNALQPSSKPIPLKITGTANNPSVTLDYQRLTHGLNTQKEKQQAIENTLREQWQWLKPEKK